jgi:hypothetical protein
MYIPERVSMFFAVMQVGPLSYGKVLLNRNHGVRRDRCAHQQDRE